MKINLFLSTFMFFGYFPIAQSDETVVEVDIIMKRFSDSLYMDTLAKGQIQGMSEYDLSEPFTLRMSSENVPTIDPFIIGADPADRDEYPALLWYITDYQRCSASQIGPNVIITDAHCFSEYVSDDIKHVDLFLEYYPDNREAELVKMRCTPNERYGRGGNKSKFNDWTLCLLDKDIYVSRFESISMVPVGPGTVLDIFGYGCMRRADRGTISNVLSRARVQISEPVPGYENKFISIDSPVISFCVGDSGGPTMVELPDNHRTIVATNSRANSYGNVSKSAGFASTSFKEFYNKWQTKNPSAKICQWINNAPTC